MEIAVLLVCNSLYRTCYKQTTLLYRTCYKQTTLLYRTCYKQTTLLLTRMKICIQSVDM